MRLHDGQEDEPARIAAALDGDVGAREWLVRKWSAPVYRYAWRMLGNEEDARDAAQDAMVKVLRALHSYDPNRPFGTWVFQITRNTCIDEHRRRKRRASEPPGELVDDKPGPLVLVSRAERAEKLAKELDSLAPLYREVLVLYHFEHLKYTEIAEVLQIPLGTVMNRIFRARRMLRQAFDDHEGGEP